MNETRKKALIKALEAACSMAYDVELSSAELNELVEMLHELGVEDVHIDILGTVD